MNRQLLFENGDQYFGTSFGAVGETVAKVALHTGMAGYQEALSDPAGWGQMMLFTYPLIGNYGMTDEDDESRAPWLSGLIVREYNNSPSNYRYTRTLSDVLLDYDIPGIEGVDTRKIARMLEREGAMRALLTDAGCPREEGLARIQSAAPSCRPVQAVSCKRLWFSRTPNFRYTVVALDLGIKLSVVRALNRRGCNVVVVPFDTEAETILLLRPDGLLLSNGPGDVEDVPEAERLSRALLGKLPLFGLGLGHLAIARGCGAKITRLAHAHSGGNYPVRNLRTGKVEITAQGHAQTVDATSLPGTSLELTHQNLLDQSVEGLANDALGVLSIQYSAESAPGPQDSEYLFDLFIESMERKRQEVR